MRLTSDIMIELPASPEAFRDAAWDDILPFYERLATMALEATSAVIEPRATGRSMLPLSAN